MYLPSTKIAALFFAIIARPADPVNPVIKAKFGYYFSGKHLQEDYLTQIAIENYENSFFKINYNFVFKRTSNEMERRTRVFF